MPCPDEGQLIRLIGGELETEPAEQIRQHVRECPRCAALLAQTQTVWDVMGTLPEDGITSDLWPAVQAAVEAEGRREARQWVPRQRLDLMRAAASIAIAIGLGWTAGAWISPSRQPDRQTTSQAA
jgi:anti-sigma factor RsiW